jgi:N-acetyl-anhydromuramyl-L-alanine amidase AmpD
MDLNKIPFIPSPNFSSRGGRQITHIIIHAMAGTFVGSTSWFKNSKSKVSAHYLVSKKGEVISMVKPEHKAWHCGNANPFSLGIELEDLDPKTKKNCTNDPNWLTDAEFKALVDLTASLVLKHKVPEDKLEQRIIGHNNIWLRQFKNDHQDPGSFFPWNKFYEELKIKLSELDK